ncbi:class A beta-lactamase-related serine hydrolase [Streptomyces sp. WAC07061]|uniref:serine hydrolase domain-containing protein n=1 Tax=Streptomyces sp. WAC07061 TaxID=2487410 RepID=UPI000F77BDA6|nr:serine hydrolase domain-containing protein [Streptomyces sp. WAC07061]RSS61050.1 class A beta-lactamase-related serine hydrolase [Streptomyces sp. WAC07061]
MNRTASWCTAGGAVIVAALTGVLSPHAAGADDREQRSAEVMRELVPSSDGPGCAAAVGKRGEVVWEDGRGKADLATGRAITPRTVFDMASNSKQFTADAVLLLAGRHRLALDDPLSAFLDHPAAWTRDVTLGDLMRHTSHIPDYQDLLEAKGVKVTDPAGQQEALAAILASRPEQTPGTGFSYSNSNYVLLAHVVERVTGTSFPAFLQQEFFTPLHLRMTLAPAADVPGKATSYDGKDGSYTPNSSPWRQYGDGSVQTTAGELVRWADNYRTGRVGGRELLAGVTGGAVGVGDVLRPRGIEEGRYGAGVLVLPDGSLVHRGDWEQFHSTFKVSPDRNTAVTVVCNAEPPDGFRAANRLLDIWTK